MWRTAFSSTAVAALLVLLLVAALATGSAADPVRPSTAAGTAPRLVDASYLNGSERSRIANRVASEIAAEQTRRGCATR